MSALDISKFSTKFYGGEQQSLRDYLNDIRKYTVPTSDEETELFYKIKGGDMKAKNELVTRNQRFIYAIAKIYSQSEENVLDYVNEANIGFLEAMDSYDPTVGTRLLTHAVWYIRRQLSKYASGDSIIVRTNNIKYARKIEKLRQTFYAREGRFPTNDEIVEMMGSEFDINVKDVSYTYDINVTSISDFESDDSDSVVQSDADYNRVTSSENECEKGFDTEYTAYILDKCTSILREKEMDVIKMYFGIGYERSYSALEIGCKYGMDEDDVSRYVSMILKYLRQNLNTELSVAAV